MNPPATGPAQAGRPRFRAARRNHECEFGVQRTTADSHSHGPTEPIWCPSPVRRSARIAARSCPGSRWTGPSRRWCRAPSGRGHRNCRALGRGRRHDADLVWPSACWWNGQRNPV